MRALLMDKFYADGFEEGYVFCKLCKAKLRSERTSNLKRHMRTMHKANFESVLSVTTPNTALEEDINFKKRKTIKIDVSLSKLLRSCIGLVTENNVPLNALYSGNFRSIIDPICRSIRKSTGKITQLNAYTWGKAFQIVANYVREIINDELNDKLISIKVNISNTSCIIMAHFIKEDAMRTVTLRLVKLENGINKLRSILEEVKKTLYLYDIDLSQVVSITVGLKNDVRLKSVTDALEKNSNEDLGDTQIFQCVALVANQCGLDVLYKDEFQEYLEICRQIARLTDVSKSYREAFESNDVTLPQIDCESRWETTYDMVCVILSAKNLFINPKYELRDIDDKPYIIPLAVWDFAECFMEAMGPLRRTVKRYQQEDLNYNDFYAQWLKCKLSTECIVKKNAACTDSLKYQIGSAVLEAMQSRDIENDCLYACLHLDPRFHRMLKPFQKEKAVDFLKRLWDKLSPLRPENSPQTSATADIEDELLDKYLRESVEIKVPVDFLSVYSKIDCLQLPFLKSEAEIVKFWKDKRFIEPELYQLRQICSCIPPTQIMSNSVSSALNSVVEKNHNCTTEQLENILLVKLNSSNLDNAIVGCLPMLETLCGKETSEYNDEAFALQRVTSSRTDLDGKSIAVHDDTLNFTDDTCVESNNSLNLKEELRASKDVEETVQSNESFKASKESISHKKNVNDKSRDEQYKRKGRNRNSGCLCGTCGKKYKNLYSLKTHMLQHSGKRNFKCSKCPKSFLTLGGLSEHEKTHTVHKPYVCELCGSPFRTKFELKIHKRYHTGTKNFQCDYCKQRFINNGHKQRHMRIHTGEKPYRCTFCDRAFVQSNDLNKHLKQHLGENIYECRFCDTRFPLLRELRIHLTTHKDETGTEACILESREVVSTNLNVV